MSLIPETSQIIRLLQIVEAKAVESLDGHLTIMRFTTGWKVMVGTPDLTSAGRETLAGLPDCPDLYTALFHAALYDPVAGAE